MLSNERGLWKQDSFWICSTHTGHWGLDPFFKYALQFFFIKGALFGWETFCYFFWQWGVNGCLELPRCEPQTLRFPAWCHCNLPCLTKDHLKSNATRVEPGPDPTRAYFWPAVNKKLIFFHFSNQPDEISFDPKGKKLKNLGFLGENFQTQTQTKDG